MFLSFGDIKLVVTVTMGIVFASVNERFVHFLLRFTLTDALTSVAAQKSERNMIYKLVALCDYICIATNEMMQVL